MADSTALRMVIIITAILVSSCTIAPPERSPPRSYMLNPEISFEGLSANPVSGNARILLVNPPRALAGFDTAQMVYLRRPHEVSYYAANQWVDTPGRMLSPLLARAMRTIGLWRAVVQAPSSVRTDYLLDCDNLVLEQQFFSQPSRVRLALRAQIVETKNRAILGTRYFEIFEAAPSDDAYGGVVAANRATARLLNEMAEWLKTNVRNTK
ncbi:MAG TPA: ABC-type transport auxiliary lipoprotein family protein [Candidatus Binatia bacterium]